MGTFDGTYGPDLPVNSIGAVKTPFGIVLPPGGKVAAYVSNASVDYDSLVRANLVPTLAAGLARARAGLGDTVVVLPGHSESVADATMLDNLKAGTKIVGAGRGGLMPTFRWTATAANWALNDANVEITGLRLRMEGANGVVSGITVTAADCGVFGCELEVASGASNKAAIMCTVSAGADRFVFANNIVRGTATHNMTDGILISAAVSNVQIVENFMFASATAANGLVRATAAALGLRIHKNQIVNTHTSSTVAIALGSAALTGVVSDNHLGIQAVATITSGTNGVSFSGSVAARFFNNLVSDAAGSGILMPGVVT